MAELSQKHKHVLDLYLGAGDPACTDNGTRSWLAVYPDAKVKSAGNQFSVLKGRPEAQAYLEKRRIEVEAARVDRILYTEEQADSDLAKVQKDAMTMVPWYASGQRPRDEDDEPIGMEMRDRRTAMLVIEKRAANARGNLGGVLEQGQRPHLNINMDFGSSASRPAVIEGETVEEPPAIDKTALDKLGGKVVTIGRQSVSEE